MPEKKNLTIDKRLVKATSLILTLLVIVFGFLTFILMLHLYKSEIDMSFNETIDGTYGLFFQYSSRLILSKVFLFLELIFSPFIYIFITKHIDSIYNKENFISLLKITIVFLFISSIVLSTIGIIPLLSIAILSVVLLLGLLFLFIMFINGEKRLFLFTLLGVPLYILLQFYTPVVIPSELNYLGSELLVNNVTKVQKENFQNSMLGLHLDKNSTLIKLLPIEESFDEINYDSVKNELNLILPSITSNPKEAYFFLEKNNFPVICYQLKKQYWGECRNYLSTKRINSAQNNISENMTATYNKFLDDYHVVNMYDDKRIPINKIYSGNKFFMQFYNSVGQERGYQMHHFQNFESPLYSLPSEKLPASQYGTLSLYVVDFIGQTVASLSSKDNIFLTVISGPQILNILIYILLLFFIWILKNDDIVKSVVSLSIFAGLILLLFSTDTYAPGLSLFRVAPQLLLVLFALSQLSKGANKLYLTVPSVSLYISLFLLFYNFEFAIFTIVAATISILFSSENLRSKMIILSIGVISFLLYLWLKVIFVDSGPMNARMLNYLTNVGIPVVPITFQFVLISICVLLPIMILFMEKNIVKKTNLLFIITVSMFMFIKYIWNPRFNHLVSILPFTLFPWIALYYVKSIDRYASIWLGRYRNDVEKYTIGSSLEIKKSSFLQISSWVIFIKYWTYKYFLRHLFGRLNYAKFMFFSIFLILLVTIIIHAKGYLGLQLSKQNFISNIKTDSSFAFPRTVYVDSSMKNIFDDYSKLIGNHKEKIFLVTPHDMMLSMMGKVHTGSPYTDFSTNIRTQSDMKYIMNTIQNEKEKYCIVSDRVDLFYYSPYVSENNEEEKGLLENNQKEQIYSNYESTKAVKNLARLLNTDLKHIGTSQYFELHCK